MPHSNQPVGLSRPFVPFALLSVRVALLSTRLPVARSYAIFAHFFIHSRRSAHPEQAIFTPRKFGMAAARLQLQTGPLQRSDRWPLILCWHTSVRSAVTWLP